VELVEVEALFQELLFPEEECVGRFGDHFEAYINHHS
jgi:hypothetical protein